MFVLPGRSCTICSPSEAMVMPDHPMDHSQGLDPLGLVAGRFDALGMGEVLDQATQQDPDRRDLTGGAAGNAMGLKGLGCVPHALSLVPRFFHKQPTSQLIAPRGAPRQRHEDAWGRAWETLYKDGVTALYSLLAGRAATRLGLTPPCVHRDTTSGHGDGRYHRDEAPDAQVVHIPRGPSRDHRPDLHQVVLEWIVAPQAGMPVRRTALRGNRSAGPECGHVVTEPLAPLHPTCGTPALVAESALSSNEHLP